jgi:hypothetical protein
VRFTIRRSKDGAEYDLVGDHATTVFEEVYEPQGFQRLGEDGKPVKKSTGDEKAPADEKKSADDKKTSDDKKA